MRSASLVVFAALALAACKSSDHPPQGAGPSMGASATPNGAGRASPSATEDAGAAPTARVLVSGLSTTSGLAADASNVYVATAQGALLAVPRAGGAAVTLAFGLISPTDLALVGGRLFWVSAGAIVGLTLPASSPQMFASDTVAPTGITGTSTDVLWVEQQDLGSTSIALVTRPLAGGPRRTIASHAGQSAAGRAIVLGATGYFAASDEDQAALLLRTPLAAAGDDAEVLATIPNGGIADMATDGAEIFLSVAAPNGAPAGQILAISPATGKSRILASGVAGPDHIAVAAGNVYFTRPAAGYLVRIPSAGGVAVAVASGLSNPTALAADASVVHVLVSDGVVDVQQE